MKMTRHMNATYERAFGHAMLTTDTHTRAANPAAASPRLSMSMSVHCRSSHLCANACSPACPRLCYRIELWELFMYPLQLGLEHRDIEMTISQSERMETD